LGIGARLVAAKNTYSGYVSDVTINTPEAYGGTQTPGNYLRVLANTDFVGAESPLGQTLIGTASQLDVQTDLEANVIRKGTGVTPVFSLNFAPNDMLNFSVKYEVKTKLELATEVIDGKDAGGMFVDGSAVVADMPAQLVVGAAIKPNDKILISTGIHYYFDKSNDYDGSLTQDIVMIDNNSFEYGLGIEYGFTEKLRLSGGWMMTRSGVNDLYQSDQRFSLNTNSFGGGLGISVLPSLDVDLGGSYTLYEDGFRGYPHSLGSNNIAVTESYDKSVWMVSVGLSFSFEKR
jgi:long-subunit fatty acid transport protein